jgi:hypothetical protein
MMLVTVPPEHMPPVSFGSTLFQRLRVVILHDGDPGGFGGPRDLGDIDPAQVLGELPLLRAAAAMAAQSAIAPPPRPRRLQGELLCDESGRLYEKIGSYVRPIHQLVAGPRGEVLDLAPPAVENKRRHDLRGASDVIDVPEAGDVGEVVQADATEIADSSAVGYRELTPRSAQPRIVRFGEFKTMIGPQLLHPERLRDPHRLSCRVRVFECARKQRLDALAADVLDGASAQLLPLTPTLAARLDVNELVAPRRPHARDRDPGWAAPGDRVVHLSVLHDPTNVTWQDTHPEAVTADSAVAASAVGHAKKSIPERFMAPWQFACSRDEAIYDLDQRIGWRSVLARWLGLGTSARDMRKWQSLLAGRSFDDQLWAVRPPRGWRSNPDVRAWTRRTLEAGGYDANAMLREWDIYWQRKGEAR